MSEPYFAHLYSARSEISPRVETQRCDALIIRNIYLMKAESGMLLWRYPFLGYGVRGATSFLYLQQAHTLHRNSARVIHRNGNGGIQVFAEFQVVRRIPWIGTLFLLFSKEPSNNNEGNSLGHNLLAIGKVDIPNALHSGRR